MRLFCLIALSVSGVLAGLSLLALPMWLLGVPGVDNSYAKGWKIGLFAVLLYPIAWLIIFTFWRTARKHMAAEHLPALNLSIGAGSLIVLAVAASVIFYSYKIMSRT